MMMMMKSESNDDSTITEKSGGEFCLYLIGFDTDLDGVVDDTLNGDEDLHCPPGDSRSTFN